MNFWIFCWIGFVLFYGVSIKYDFHMQQWKNVLYIAQLSADILIGYFSLVAFRNRVFVRDKKFYFFIFISLIPGLFTNEVYNLIINLSGVKNITAGMDLYWSVSYFLFLTIQIMGWFYLLLNHHTIDFQKKAIVILYAQPIIIMLLSFMVVALFGNNIFSTMNIVGVINSSLEVVLFILISICLSRTKNNSLVTLESGFLLLIAFNIMHRLSYVTGHYTKLFDAVWMLSLVMIIFGLSRSYANRDEKIEFFQGNSIHSITSAIFVSFATCLFILFIVIGFVFSSLEVGKVSDYRVFSQNIPSILISSYLLTLLISRIVSDFVTNPLHNLYKKINLVYEDKRDNSICENKEVDIFEINELEKFTLHTIQQLQTASRVKTDFLMNMSHDFRTPASGIYQMAGYVHKKLENSDLTSYMKLIVDSSRQLINLLDDVLDYSRLDSDRWNFAFEKFDITTVIHDVILCLSAKAKEKSLELTNVFCEKPLHYFGDKLAINRIVLNLISNAIKFTDEGFITVALKKHEIECQPWIVVEIKDTGIGILPQHHQTIFEPFNRISSVENAKYPGIGLGLSNANLVTKKMGGKITVESEINLGSVFSIYLPIKNKNDEKSV